MRTVDAEHAALWVGVDVGTQSLRVLIADGTGREVGRGTSRLHSQRAAGSRHWQRPEDWWDAFGSACREATAALAGAGQASSASRIAGVAIAATSGTFLLADEAGSPCTPALMYDDARAVAQAAQVQAAGSERWTALGYAIQPAWALPKLLWLAQQASPPIRAGLADGRLRLLHCADYLASRLHGGPVATDWSNALKTGYDCDLGAWPADVLDRLGIDPMVLPAVVRPGSAIGTVGRDGARHTGLPAGTPIRAGLTDGCAAQVAAGALRPGAWNSVLGTTLVLKGVTERRLADPDGAVYSHRHPDGGWLPGGASNIGAGALAAWFPGVDHERADADAARHEPADRLVYPLTATGERFPFVRPDAEPFEIGGLVDGSDRYAAVLQSVAYVERLCYAVLRRLGADVTGALFLTGGATASPYWTQLRADILGRAVRLPDCPEPAFGMAVVAAAGDGPLTETARRMVRASRTVEPRPGAAARFADTYRRFLDALAARGWISDDLARYAQELT
ncbi:FGGY-family carbohydrate kinase [Rugosimonospora acidiphila]|uniref:FGGY-family carbohydrate kinase n=1 Tax=Rugosimonospora acidiphila TaxID=556531 RepID=A0ABP9RJM4_9ACTN